MISPGGLLGLVTQIDIELSEGKTLDEVLSNYPVSKTSLPYMLTLVREFNSSYKRLEDENIKLKEHIKSFESKKEHFDTQYTENLKIELNRLKRENKSLKSDIEDYEEQIDDYKSFLSFCSSSFFGRRLVSKFKTIKSKK
jgi:chromosome segregation ATPase